LPDPVKPPETGPRQDGRSKDDLQDRNERRKFGVLEKQTKVAGVIEYGWPENIWTWINGIVLFLFFWKLSDFFFVLFTFGPLCDNQ